MVTEYCQCADDLPMLITDVMGRLVDMLKVSEPPPPPPPLPPPPPPPPPQSSMAAFQLYAVLQLAHMSVGLGSRSCGGCWIEDYHCEALR